MSMVANKFKGIYAALCYNKFTAEMAKKHNNANILILPARVIDKNLTYELIDTFLKTVYEGGRHDKRLNKIKEIENKNFKD